MSHGQHSAVLQTACAVLCHHTHKPIHVGFGSWEFPCCHVPWCTAEQLESLAREMKLDNGVYIVLVIKAKSFPSDKF